jgi:non-heme chloroperoxidase
VRGTSGPALSELLRPLEGAEGAVERPDGTRLRVVDAGAGQDVLLVHGFAMSADAWSVVQPALVDRGRRVIAYDQRGHGRSSCGSRGIGSTELREDLHTVAEEYDVRDATLVCHSMGNFVALGLLADPTFSKRFRRAVLVNPVTGSAGKGSPAVVLQAPMIRAGINQRLMRNRRIGNILAGLTLGPAASANVLEATRQSMVAISPSLTPCISMLRRESVESVLRDVRLPVHVLTATEDTMTPTWHAELIVARAPDARIDYIADAGHMLIWEAPEAIVQAVTEEESD